MPASHRLGINRRTALGVAVSTLAGAPWLGAHAADKYPSKPVTIIVPYAAGGSTDVVARVIAQKLSEIVDGNSLYEDKNSSEAVVMNPRDIIAQIGREQNLEPRDVQRLYEVIRQNYQQGEDIKIDGRARSWEYAAIAFASYRSGARSVSFYSPDGYVSLKSGEYEDANRIEHDEYDTTRQAVDSHTVHIEVRLNVAKVNPDILNELTIPTVDSSKTIIISGRMPMWLAASVALSYKDAVEKIAYFVPGQEAPVVWARDESDLGSVVSI